VLVKRADSYDVINFTNEKYSSRFCIFFFNSTLEDYFSELAILPPFRFSDDGFAVTAAEPWIREKTSVIAQYLQSYTNLHAGKCKRVNFY
jgi:hypothetical protein